MQFCTLVVIATVAGLPMNKTNLSNPSLYILEHPSQRMLVSFPPADHSLGLTTHVINQIV